MSRARFPKFRGFYLSQEMSDLFNELAEHMDKSKGDMFREAICRYVKHKKKLLDTSELEA